MEMKVHSVVVNLSWQLMNTISQIDRFDASWTSIERVEGQTLKELKSIATVRSVGASTRIEGSRMSDEEVGVLLEDISIEKMDDRDAQEVAGYFETLDLIAEDYDGIRITENDLKALHKRLMIYSAKDRWHRGDYKQQSNSVEATHANGQKEIIFETAAPGMETEGAMRNLVKWYREDQETHTLVKCALFAYDFLSIHPFQDGNGRLSRLISTLLLLKEGYKWIQYISFEHEIENRKGEYYQVLRSCQGMRPGENVGEWLRFFLDALQNIQEQLMKKLEVRGLHSQLAPREKSILAFVGSHPGCKSGEIARRLDIPSSTVKRILPELLEKKLIAKYGIGPGTNYSLA